MVVVKVWDDEKIDYIYSIKVCSVVCGYYMQVYVFILIFYYV